MLDQLHTSEDRLRQFVADASHELRTPVAAIGGFADLYRHGAVVPRDLDDVMRRIGQESARMRGLVEDLLLLAQLDEGRPSESELLDVAQLAGDAVLDASARFPSRTVTVDGDSGVTVMGDEARIRQVLANLVTNSLNYTSGAVEIHVRAGKERATIAVRDHGPGLEPEALARAFDRFWRSPEARSQPGTGLGLSIVRGIVAAHGGTVEMDSSRYRDVCPRFASPLRGRPRHGRELSARERVSRQRRRVRPSDAEGRTSLRSSDVSPETDLVGHAPAPTRGNSPIVPLLVSVPIATAFVVLRWWDAAHRQLGEFVVAGSLYATPGRVPKDLPLGQGSGYDGQFYYRLAVDPFDLARSAFGISFDSFSRVERIGYPFLAWMVAGGQHGSVPLALVIVNVVACGAVAFGGGLLAQSAGRHALWGLVFAGYWGYLWTLGRDLTELTAAAFVLLGLAAWTRHAPVWSGIALLCAVLSKETSVLLVAALGVAVLWVRVTPGRSDSTSVVRPPASPVAPPAHTPTIRSSPF